MHRLRVRARLCLEHEEDLPRPAQAGEEQVPRTCSPIPLRQRAHRHQWSQHIVDADVLDIENITDALETGPYGRCVYECGNDIVDHQVVNIEYEDGVTASMTMSACESSLPTVREASADRQSPSRSAIGGQRFTAREASSSVT